MRQSLRVRIVRTHAVRVGPYWIPLSARSRRGWLSAIGAFSFIRLAVFVQ